MFLQKKMLVQHTVTYRWKKHVLSITQNLLFVIYIFSSTHLLVLLFYFTFVKNLLDKYRI